MTRWTPEARRLQSELIRRWKPWQQSTGPKTSEGKAVVSQNGYKGGLRQQLRELSKLLREQKKSLENVG
ncbi:ATPase P [Novimethylophilus kurashikiensis]|uniref:ATPase P n=1 Tax=Novimethylophilus kurashikiensis TaxID=1825523 RepID=A0A2R5FAY1_9PROT|nr:ATPase P [Novimethylophilus kurashikiensis]